MKRILILFLILSLCNSCFGAAIAQWKMNDDANNTTVTDSVGTYTGTFYDATGDPNTDAHTTTGHINAAFALDGTDDYITVSDDDVFTPDGTPMSITAWISLSADEGALEFVIASKAGLAGIEWNFWISDDDLYFILYDYSAATAKIGRYDSTTDYSLYEGSGFIFVVCTYDGHSSSDGIKLYLNGQQVDDSDDISGTFVNVDNSNEDIYIGKWRYGEILAKDKIDNIVIYNNELTKAQVVSLYNNGVGTEEVGSGSLESVAENIARPRTKYGYRKYYRNRY